MLCEFCNINHKPPHVCLTCFALHQEEPVKQAEQAGLLPEEVTTIKIFQRNTPSVVNITNIREVSNRFYSMDTQKIPTGTGSGFIWDDKGHVITNFHVIKVCCLTYSV